MDYSDKIFDMLGIESNVGFDAVFRPPMLGGELGQKGFRIRCMIDDVLDGYILIGDGISWERQIGLLQMILCGDIEITKEKEE